MPDLSPTERRQAIVTALRSEQWQRAEDLAETLSVSRRTIYRDVQELLETGLPIAGVPGTGYRLDLGLRCAPPEALTPEAGTAVAHPLREALAEQHTVRFAYRRGTQASVSETVDPYGLVQHGSRGGHLVGWCHGQQRVRQFRLRAIGAVEVLDDTFSRPASYAGTAPNGRASQDVRVRVWFSAEVAPRVRSGDGLPPVGMEEVDDGLIATLRVPRPTDLLPWILSWGGQARVLEPTLLQQRVAREARSIAARYREEQRLL